jgi:hypothetical protein
MMKKIIFTLAIMISATVGTKAQSIVFGTSGRNGSAVLVVNERGIYVNGNLRTDYPDYRMRPERVAMAGPGFSIGTVGRVVIPSRRYVTVPGRDYDRYAIARERCMSRDRNSRYDGNYSGYNNHYSAYDDDCSSYNGRYSSNNNRYGTYNNGYSNDDDDNDGYYDNNSSRYNNNNNSGDDRIDFQR